MNQREFRSRQRYRTRLGAAYYGESAELLTALPDGSVQAIVTSPPFALKQKKQYGNPSEDAYLDWFLTFVPEFRRVLKEDGSLVIDIGGAWMPGSPTRSIYQFELLISLVRDEKFFLAEEFYWYNRAKLPGPAQWVTVDRIRVKDTVNPIWWLSKTTNPKADNRRVLRPYSDSMHELFKRGYNKGRRPSGHVVRDKFSVDNGGAIPPNLIEVSNTRSSDSYQVFCREAEWETVHGRPYRLLGGHRLWSSPECPLNEQVPDDAPVGVRTSDDGVELTGATLTHERLARRIELRLATEGPRVRVTHTLENHTGESVHAAAWALTQVTPGGVAVLPFDVDAPDGDQLPNRNVVLWPYSSVHDTRFELTDDAMRVSATDDPGHFKVGYLNRAGWIAYELDDVTFRKRFEPELNAEHVDFGCNVEVYTRAELLELETLTPLRHIPAGGSIEHVEEWELLRT